MQSQPRVETIWWERTVSILSRTRWTLCSVPSIPRIESSNSHRSRFRAKLTNVALTLSSFRFVVPVFGPELLFSVPPLLPLNHTSYLSLLLVPHALPRNFSFADERVGTCEAYVSEVEEKTK